MNLQDIRHLIDYHYWARNRILEAVALLSPEQFTREVGGSFGSVHNTLVHILSAEGIWLLRWKGESPSGMPAPEKFADLNAIREAWTVHESKLRAFLEGFDELGIQ